MRKIISIILVIAITASLAIPAFAKETEAPQYGSVKVEYSDSRGSIENLEVMILDGYVYANVDSFSSRLGYKWEQNENVVSIYSTASLWGEQTPALALHFRIGDTTVSYNPMCGIEVEYTTPAPCVQNERGIWVPFSYTLYLLGGSRNIAGDVVTVQMPAQNVLSIAAMITNNESALSFDWVDDFGYSEQTTNVTDGAARVVTLFKGLLAFDGSAWSSFIDWNAFDKKFGRSLAAMLCTYSSDELMESIEEVEVLVDVFDDNGALGSMLRTQQTLIDSDVNAWSKVCEEQLNNLKAGSGTLPQYNMAYQQYERATKQQDLFSAVGADDLMYIQDELSSATNVLDKATKIGYAVSYLSEFQQRDSFQATVLQNYFATRKDTDLLDDATASAIAGYASSGIIKYTAQKFCEEHLLEIIVDETGLDALMGAPANLLLLAWDIMSETIPFYSEGLESVEAREISNYAQQVQNDAALNVNTLIASLRADSASLSPEDCVQLAEYCYVYLKSCYIARSSAIDSLDNISEEARKELESKINVEMEINLKIAEYLSVLSRADSANSCYILGFLPKNNEELVDMYTDESIVSLFTADITPEEVAGTLVSDAFSDYGILNNGRVNNYRIPKINIAGETAEQTNKTIYNDLYYGVYEKIENKQGDCFPSGITYIWAQNHDIVSILVEWQPENYTGHVPTEYVIYNASTVTGKLLSLEDVIQAYGLTTEEFHHLAKDKMEQCYVKYNGTRDNCLCGDIEYYDQCKQETICDENVGNVRPFIDVNGDLCIIAWIGNTAVGGKGQELVNLTGESEPQAPAFSWVMPEEKAEDTVPSEPQDSGVTGEYFIGTVTEPDAGATAISTAQELVANITADPAGNYVLACDIDLSTYNRGVWVSLERFTGTLDGQGHVIRNLKVTSYEDAGLFLNVNNAIFKDLGIEAIEISGFENTGVISAKGTATFTNCYMICPKLSGGDNVGGLIGRGDTLNLKDVFIDVSIQGNAEAYYSNIYEGYASVCRIGGIIGKGSVDATNIDIHCDITITGSGKPTDGEIMAGGAIGCSDQAQSIKIINAEVDCNINVKTARFISWKTLSSGRRSYDNVDVRVGGLIGDDYHDEGSYIQNAIVISNCNVNASIDVDAYGTPCVGGFIGYEDGYNNSGKVVTISDSTLNGNISALCTDGSYAKAGGIFGDHPVNMSDKITIVINSTTVQCQVTSSGGYYATYGGIVSGGGSRSIEVKDSSINVDLNVTPGNGDVYIDGEKQ